MTLPPPEFRTFDPKMAAAIMEGDTFIGGGLPGYLGIRHTECEAGRLVAEIDVRDDLKIAFGTLHGGVVSALVDHVLGTVMYPVMERGCWAATADFKVNLMGPARDGVVRAEAQIISMTKRTGVVRIDVTCEGRAVAAAQGTVMIQYPK